MEINCGGELEDLIGCLLLFALPALLSIVYNFLREALWSKIFQVIARYLLQFAANCWVLSSMIMDIKAKK